MECRGSHRGILQVRGEGVHGGVRNERVWVVVGVVRFPRTALWRDLLRCKRSRCRNLVRSSSSSRGSSRSSTSNSNNSFSTK